MEAVGNSYSLGQRVIFTWSMKDNNIDVVYYSAFVLYIVLDARQTFIIKNTRIVMDFFF